MSLLDTLISKIAPHDCLACGAEGRLLCIGCENKLAAIPEQCYGCRQASARFLTCSMCLKTGHLRRVSVAVVYETAAKDLIWQLKLAGAQAAAEIMARRLAGLIKDDTESPVIVPIPTATNRMRHRGYDQARLLARMLARQTQLPYLPYLSRIGQTHQHGASRQERLSQLTDAFRVTRTAAVRDQHIILVDDVLTTGATLEAAAATFKQAGANRIDALVFARPQRQF